MRKLTFTLTMIAGLLAGLFFTPGTASADRIPPYRFWNESTSGLAVNGTYTPVVGNFGGSAQDDIVWWGPGSASDSIWLSNNDATFAKPALSPRITAEARSIPVVGNFGGSAHEDILWYGPGSMPDAMWISQGDGRFTTRAVTVGGTYTPVLIDDASGGDEIAWVNRATNTASVWAFPSLDGAPWSLPAISVPAGARPVVGDFDGDGCGEVFWYTSNTTADWLDRMNCGGAVRSTHVQRVDGVYTPIVQQFSPAGGTTDDILWYGGASPSLLSESLGDGTFRTATHHVPAGGPVSSADPTGFVMISQPTRYQVWLPAAPGVDVVLGSTNTVMPEAYRAIVGSFVGTNEDIFWYQPGSAPERMFHLAR